MDISLYDNIIVEPSNSKSVCNISIENSGIVTDYFDSLMSSHTLNEN